VPNIAVILKSGLGVIQGQIFQCKYSSICYRFRMTGCWRILWPWPLHYGSLKVTGNGTTL